MNITRQMATEVERFVDKHGLVAFEVNDYSNASDNFKMRIGVIDVDSDDVISDYNGISSSLMNKLKKILNIKRTGTVDVEALVEAGLIEYYGVFDISSNSTAYDKEYDEYLNLCLRDEMVTV